MLIEQPETSLCQLLSPETSFNSGQKMDSTLDDAPLVLLVETWSFCCVSARQCKWDRLQSRHARGCRDDRKARQSLL